MNIVLGDISKSNSDVIVNAANGIGYMGGTRAVHTGKGGVAQSINHASKGLVEQHAKIACRKSTKLPRILCGHRAGELYVTPASGLNSKYVFHAVTMYLPGLRSNLVTISKLLDVIVQEAKRLDCQSVSIPLLGAGTGGISVTSLERLYESKLSRVGGLDISVYLLEK